MRQVVRGVHWRWSDVALEREIPASTSSELHCHIHGESMIWRNFQIIFHRCCSFVTCLNELNMHTLGPYRQWLVFSSSCELVANGTIQYVPMCYWKIVSGIVIEMCRLSAGKIVSWHIEHNQPTHGSGLWSPVVICTWTWTWENTNYLIVYAFLMSI